MAPLSSTSEKKRWLRQDPALHDLDGDLDLRLVARTTLAAVELFHRGKRVAAHPRAQDTGSSPRTDPPNDRVPPSLPC